MTTLDPSHFPWRARDDDPRKGAAVHTSVRPPVASTSAAGHRQAPLSSDDSEDVDADDEEHGRRHIWRSKRRRTRKDRKRRDHEDARAHGRIPTIPVPDVRFEQSYLMSIQPFIQSTPVSATATQANSEKQQSVTEKTPQKSRRDKRIKVEESLALVSDPAFPTGTVWDDLFRPSPEKLVTIQWAQIAYITFRDQLFSPLVQGALWAFGGLLLSSMWSGWKGSRSTPAQARPSRGSGLKNLLGRFFGSIQFGRPEFS